MSENVCGARFTTVTPISNVALPEGLGFRNPSGTRVKRFAWSPLAWHL
jgi:hypothetical protein